MTILLAPDSFKDSLSAEAVADALGEGLQRAVPQLRIRKLPLADGGEGTAAILTKISRGVWHNVQVCDPLWRTVDAGFGISGDGTTAFVELAEASGIQLLETSERNPLHTTTYGTGQLLIEAIGKGVDRILLCVGSSATNDCGMGMAAALGFKFLDIEGQLLSGKGGDLARVAEIVEPEPSSLSTPPCTVLCDVRNPLFGPDGAAYVYGPQKGASTEIVALLDDGLRHFSRKLEDFSQRKIANIPGAGAAGGLGAGAIAFLKGELQSGIEVVLEYTNFDSELAHADLVITGEGKIDRQTLEGKVISGVVHRAKTFGVPVIGICGTLQAMPEEIESLGLSAAFSLAKGPVSLSDALLRAEQDLMALGYNLGSLINLFAKP